MKQKAMINSYTLNLKNHSIKEKKGMKVNLIELMN